MVSLSGLAAWAHGVMTQPAWLDGAFVSFRYARRLSDRGSLALIGQSAATEGFDNPLWTALLSVLGMLGVHEFRVQTHLGPVLFGLLTVLTCLAIVRRVSRPEGVLLVLLLLMASPLAISAQSGTDDLFVAVLLMSAVVSVMSDLERDESSRRSAGLLTVLALSGMGPALLALVLAWPHRRRWGFAVIGAFLALTVVRVVVFGAVVPQAVVSELSAFNIDNLISNAQVIPVTLGVGLAGLAISQRGGARVWPMVAAVGIIGSLAVFGPGSDFGAPFVPIMGVLALGGAMGIDRLRHRGVGILILIAVAGVDTRVGFDDRAQAAHGRISIYKQAEVMTRFLRWRLTKDDLVVTQTPGILPYMLRRPTFDLRGATHSQPVDSTSVLAMGAPAMMPLGRIVSVNAERLSMGDDWDWRVVAKTHHQHALQYNPEWEIKGVPRVWFNLYMRADLPKFLPGWDEEKARKQ
jgi:hypothetical protein